MADYLGSDSFADEGTIDISTYLYYFPCCFMSSW
jgi:hypothetical protein